MAAAQILAILVGVALATVGGGQRLGDGKASVRQRLLALDGLVAIQAGHAHLHVATALELVDDGRRLAAMALRALARGADEGRRRLLHLDLGAKSADYQGGDDQRAADGDGNENRAEGHGVWFLLAMAPKRSVAARRSTLPLQVYFVTQAQSYRENPEPFS
jgi:hypothetical protein